MLPIPVPQVQVFTGMGKGMVKNTHGLPMQNTTFLMSWTPSLKPMEEDLAMQMEGMNSSLNRPDQISLALLHPGMI
jgi:hypothetical protein